MSNTQKGTVKFFNESKGYGFITPDNPNTKDVFVHISAVNSSKVGTIKEGDRLEFTLEEDRGKTCAGSLSRAA